MHLVLLVQNGIIFLIVTLLIFVDGQNYQIQFGFGWITGFFSEHYREVRMNENKLGRKFATCWSKPRNKIAKRLSSKGLRKRAKLLIFKVGD
jgi:hypothetical protein